ncbi:hypothetical protein BJX70DRAFT_194376 [Aspergillus crustosus]
MAGSTIVSFELNSHPGSLPFHLCSSAFLPAFLLLLLLIIVISVGVITPPSPSRGVHRLPLFCSRLCSTIGQPVLGSIGSTRLRPRL